MLTRRACYSNTNRLDQNKRIFFSNNSKDLIQSEIIWIRVTFLSFLSFRYQCFVFEPYLCSASEYIN